MESKRYIEAVRKLTNSGTNYAIAKLLDVSPDAIYGYVAGKRVMDNYTCLRISELTGIPLEQIIAAAEYDREKNNDRRREWGKFLRKPVALLLLAISPCIFGGDCQARPVQGLTTDQVTNYATLLRRLFQRLRRRGYALAPR